MADQRNQRNPHAAAPEWKPHELVDKLLPKLSGEQPVSVLVGFPAQSPMDGHRRLYLDPALRRCVDIPEEDIVHCQTIDKSSFKPMAVWVRADSRLQYRTLTASEVQAGFLAGRVISDNLSRAPRAHPWVTSRTKSIATHQAVCIHTDARTSCYDVCTGGGYGGGGDFTDDACLDVTVYICP